MRRRTLLFSSLSALPRCLLWNPGRRTTAWREGGLRGKATASPLNTVPQPKHGHEQQKTLRGSEKSASVQFKVKTSTFLGRFTALGRISRVPYRQDGKEGPGEIAQGLRCLPHKHKHLSSDPSTCRNAGCGQTSLEPWHGGKAVEKRGTQERAGQPIRPAGKFWVH